MSILDEKEDFNTGEVMDEGDMASEFQMREIAMARERAKANMAPETHPDFDGECCVTCGDDLHKDRLAMGKVRCVPCQEKIDLRKKMFASRSDD